ncbi:phage head spike fiber domain-containing protein [Sphingobium yanoikuyae]|uniref:phage head spike fiber domain-containing protein n=1 Tax=Sphingobium yanoikuyae TaxID=13690 RepID=UPI0013775E09|nr:hypothetical protein [Sphingobium yanoikuyae]NBB37635.1 hypothetical protein [Sphingobium yanoikuyae]
MTLAGLSPAGALIVRAGEPKTLHIFLKNREGNVQNLTGRTLSLIVRRTADRMPLHTIGAELSGDANYFVLNISAAVASNIVDAGVNSSLSHDMVETTGGGSVTRWTERVAVATGPELPDLPPVSVDLPVSQAIISPDAIVVSERGATGQSAAMGLFLAGFIDAPTVEAMQLWLEGISENVANSVVSALDGRVDAIEALNAGERLDALAPITSSQRAARLLISPVTGGGISRGDPAIYRQLQSRDLPKLTIGGRGRHIGEILDDMGRSIEWHRSRSRPFDGLVALEGALNFRLGNGTGRRHVVLSNWGWHTDSYPTPSRLSDALIDCNGIAPGAPPTFIADDPTRPILYLDGVKNLRMRRAFHAAYRGLPANTNVRAVQIRGGSSNIYIDELILENATTALYLDNCTNIRIGRIVAPNASFSVVATAAAQGVRIGDIIGGGAVSIAAGADVKVANIYDNAQLSLANTWALPQIFTSGALLPYLAYGAGGYSSLNGVTRQELFEKIEALEADRLARDSINFTGNMPDNASLTRASTGNYVNSSGVITSAAADAPRLTYRWNGNAWVSAGLLVEPASTNLFNYSEDFTNAFWTKGGVTVTANAGPALDGVTGMTLLTSTGTMVLREANVTTAVDGGVYVFSGYFKQGPTPTPWVMMTIGNAGTPTNYVRMWFNPTTGAIGSTTAVGTGWSLVGAPEVEARENGVYRVGFSAQIAGTAVCYRQDHATGNGAGGSAMPGVQLYVDKFQLEQQSRMTSYIKTTTAPASRSADVATVNIKTPRYSPKGPISVRFTFDDGSVQTRTGIALTAGAFAIPTDLNRRKVKFALNLNTEG